MTPARNGSGTVYPRKNKDGKATSYLGAYYTTDGKQHYWDYFWYRRHFVAMPPTPPPL